MKNKWLCIFTLLIATLMATVCIDSVSTRSIAIKNRGGGDLTVVIDFDKKSVPVVTAKENKPKDMTVSPKIDETTKEIVNLVPKVVSSDQDVKLAENLLTLANEIRQIERLIVGSTDEQKLLKQELLAIVGEFTKQSEKPSVFILKSSLEMVASKKKGQQATNGGTRTLFIQMAITGLNAVMNFASGIGTYSNTINKVGGWISGTVANKLESFGLKGVASVARNAGQGIQTLSQKIAPFEQKLAKAIAPLVQSKPFQAVKRVVNVVAGVISIKNGISKLGMLATKLPKTFNNLRKTLTKAAAPIKGKATSLLQKVTKTTKLIRNAKKASKAAKAAKAAKTIGKVAKPGTIGKISNAAMGAYNVKAGFGNLKSGLGKKKSMTNKKQTKSTAPQRAKSSISRTSPISARSKSTITNRGRNANTNNRRSAPTKTRTTQRGSSPAPQRARPISSRTSPRSASRPTRAGPSRPSARSSVRSSGGRSSGGGRGGRR